MAKKGKSAQRSQAVPKPEALSVSAKLREANPWFEEGAKRVKNLALSEKKAELKALKKPLSQRKLGTAWKLLRRLERRDEQLKKRLATVRSALAGHYAHMEVEKWENEFLEALAWPSYKLGLNHSIIQAKLDESSWKFLTKPQLQIPLLLAAIASGRFENLKDSEGGEMSIEDLRKLVIRSIVVSEKPSITVAAPSEAGEQAKKAA